MLMSHFICCYAECHCWVSLLSVIMLNVIILSLIEYVWFYLLLR